MGQEVTRRLSNQGVLEIIYSEDDIHEHHVGLLVSKKVSKSLLEWLATFWTKIFKVGFNLKSAKLIGVT